MFNNTFFLGFFVVINGEKAAFNTPVFAQKRTRTLDMLIKNLYQDYMPESNKVLAIRSINHFYSAFILYFYKLLL